MKEFKYLSKSIKAIHTTGTKSRANAVTSLINLDADLNAVLCGTGLRCVYNHVSCKHIKPNKIPI